MNLLLPQRGRVREMSYVMIGALVLFAANVFLALVSILIRRTRTTTRKLAQPAQVIVGSPVLVNRQADAPPQKNASAQTQASRPTLQSITVPFSEPSINASESAAAKGALITAALQPTDFRSLGLPPMAQGVTTYVFGDDLFDESFSITDASGDLLAEMGVAVSEGVDWEDGKNIVAFELWLFDAKSGETNAQILLTPAGFETAAIRRRFEKQGHVNAATNDLWLTLQSKNITVRARVVNVKIRPDTDVPDIIFERLIIEMAAWPNDGSAPVIGLEDMPDTEPVALEPDIETPPTKLVAAGPHIYQQKIEASYTVEYASRVYLGQPFTVVVQFGTPDSQRKAHATIKRRSGSNEKDVGVEQVTFTHETYQEPTILPQFEPEVQINVRGSEFEFQIPIQQRSFKLRNGLGTRLEFDVKPLDTGSLLLLVETVYLGQKYVPERELGTTIMKNPETGEVESMSTRKAPSGYYSDPQTVARETLNVRVQTILGFQPGALNFLTWFLGLLNVLIYVLIGAFSLTALDGANAIIAITASTAATVPLLTATIVSQR